MLVDEETLRKYLEMEEQLKANSMLMQGYEQTFEERLAEAKAKALMNKKEVIASLGVYAKLYRNKKSRPFRTSLI
jgi:L-rhamnose isomerase